jgi:sugar transferase (PEP-CTERM/EpsH1 system associated)
VGRVQRITGFDAVGSPMPSNQGSTVPRKILVLTPQFPYPPHQGTTMRNFNLVAGLSHRHEVHLLAFGDPDKCQDTPLDVLCQSIQVVPPPERTMSQRLRGLFLSRLPDMAQRLPSTEFQERLVTTLAREKPHIVEVEGIELAQYLFQVAEYRADASSPLLVYDDHNAEYVLQQRAFETDARQPRRWIAAAYSFVQWKRLQGYERRACEAADRVVAVSETDAGALRQLSPGLEPAVVPNGVDMAFCTAVVPPLAHGTGPADEDIVFTAKMDFRPNVDAVQWFAQDILPLIREKSPQTRFWVVGKDPHPRLEPLAKDPAIVITGWVEDVRPYIAAAGIYVVPLRMGGGTRLKVLEAMAMGKAIVSTTVGSEGFDVLSGQELVVADTPEEFAQAVADLLRDPHRRQQMGSVAREFAGSGYDWPIVVPMLERVYEGS